MRSAQHQHQVAYDGHDECSQPQQVQPCAEHGLQALVPAETVFLIGRYGQVGGIVEDPGDQQRLHVGEHITVHGEVAPVKFRGVLLLRCSQSPRERLVELAPVLRLDETPQKGLERPVFKAPGKIVVELAPRVVETQASVRVIRDPDDNLIEGGIWQRSPFERDDADHALAQQIQLARGQAAFVMRGLGRGRKHR
ncbi:hypothetical protein D3C75_954990 [compost metagenome]